MPTCFDTDNCALHGIKNIVIVCDYGYIEGGAARIAHETAIALQAAGKQVFFFCAVGPISEDLSKAGVEVTCLGQADILHERNRIKGALRGISNRTASKSFEKLLSRLRSEHTVIHVHTWTKGVSSSIFPVAEKMGFCVFLTVHDYFLVCPNGGLFEHPHSRICERKPLSLSCLMCNCDARSYSQKIFRVMRQYVQNWNIRRRKNIYFIFISAFSKKQFIRRYNKIPADRQLFLANMINFPENRTRVKCEQNSAFLFIGGIIEIKGIGVFCEAVTKAGVPGIVIGEGILRKELESRYPNIQFVGWKEKSEMQAYMEKARCLIFPSICYEVSPLTTLEVMAYGIPVICSDKNAASKQIKNGETGWLYNGDSIEDLVRLIKRCAEEKQLQKISEQVFSDFRTEEFGTTRYIEQLLEIYTRYSSGCDLIGSSDTIGTF